jgi:hypothetical protein
MAYNPSQKTTKLTGRKSTATDPSLSKRRGATSAAPKSHSAVAAKVPNSKAR